MQKSSAMECLYEDGKKAHVKFACFFGWIERFCEAFKNPIVKPDSTLLTFERYVEREARFVPRALQSMEFWEVYEIHISRNIMREDFLNHHKFPRKLLQLFRVLIKRRKSIPWKSLS
eukprot:TRINITY_DN310_c0_g1_i3.p1 TRINITY_DN310_c0_g1~~TRINITY_DN310_c0_g1_i3.p1  ORF type:complete len:117 (-),score=19.27 TRINITY_DN310_c0_g1_i3:181-531(-)